MGLDSDQRIDERIRYETALSHECLEIGVSSHARMYNFSKGGFYFESDIPLLPGEEIFIGIKESPYAFNPNGYECHLVRVKWRKKLRNSIYQYGYGVQHDIPVEYFASTSGTVHSGEQNLPVNEGEGGISSRQYSRKPYSKLTFFTSQNQYYEGSIDNISHGGVFIETKGDLSVGQIIRIVIPGTQIDRGVMLQGEVVRLSREGVGVKFISILKDKATKNHPTE